MVAGVCADFHFTDIWLECDSKHRQPHFLCCLFFVLFFFSPPIELSLGCARLGACLLPKRPLCNLSAHINNGEETSTKCLSWFFWGVGVGGMCVSIWEVHMGLKGTGFFFYSTHICINISHRAEEKLQLESTCLKFPLPTLRKKKMGKKTFCANPKLFYEMFLQEVKKKKRQVMYSMWQWFYDLALYMRYCALVKCRRHFVVNPLNDWVVKNKAKKQWKVHSMILGDLSQRIWNETNSHHSDHTFSLRLHKQLLIGFCPTQILLILVLAHPDREDLSLIPWGNCLQW